jgi:hypothetical protein
LHYSEAGGLFGWHAVLGGSGCQSTVNCCHIQSTPVDTNLSGVQEVQQQELLDQLQQSITGPGWEPSDWDWHPTWLPAFQRLLLQPLTTQQQQQLMTTALTSPTAAGPAQSEQHQTKILAQVYKAAGLVDAGSSGTAAEEQQQTQELLAAYLRLLVDLEGPRKGLALAQDKALLGWYQASLAAAVEHVLHGSPAAAAGVGGDACSTQGPDTTHQGHSTISSSSTTTPSASSNGSTGSDSTHGTRSITHSRGCRVLVVSQGPGALLGLLAAASGASHVTVLSGGRCSHLVDQQLLQENQEVQGELCCRVELVPCSLDRCWGPAAGYGQDSSPTPLLADNKAAAGATSAGGGGWVSEEKLYRVAAAADVVVVDLFDHRWVT